MKPRPTDTEFEELKRKRDESVAASVKRFCEEEGWDHTQVKVHTSHSSGCYCACPDGPCQHIWNGLEYQEEGMSSATCSLCGAVAAYHDMRVMP